MEIDTKGKWIWICLEIMANQVKMPTPSTVTAVNWLERLLATHRVRSSNPAGFYYKFGC
jgi:hypothetical protein